PPFALMDWAFRVTNLVEGPSAMGCATQETAVIGSLARLGSLPNIRHSTGGRATTLVETLGEASWRLSRRARIFLSLAVISMPLGSEETFPRKMSKTQLRELPNFSRNLLRTSTTPPPPPDPSAFDPLTEPHWELGMMFVFEMGGTVDHIRQVWSKYRRENYQPIDATKPTSNFRPQGPLKQIDLAVHTAIWTDEGD